MGEERNICQDEARTTRNLAKSQPLSAEWGVPGSGSPPGIGNPAGIGAEISAAAVLQVQSSQQTGMRGGKKHGIVRKRKEIGWKFKHPRGFLEEMGLFFVIEKGTVVNILFICQQTCLAAPCLLPSCDRLAVVKRGALHN